tara:strand:- start:320 stop:481 length:162 start_codon:yes stop_codon:yes gene_type:complete
LSLLVLEIVSLVTDQQVPLYSIDLVTMPVHDVIVYDYDVAIFRIVIGNSNTTL